MDEKEMLAKHENQLKVCEHRIDDLEDFQKQQNDLIICVNRLADNMERMLEEQKTQGERLQKLEQEPFERWSSARRAIFNACIGAVATVVAGGAVWLVVFVIKNM